MKKIAVVLFNLGGPKGLADVFGFLFRLFYDRAIVDAPNPFRFFLALGITLSRLKKAKDIYRRMGGGSPILDNTLAQADDLREALAEKHDAKVFVCMSYSPPMATAVAREVAAFNPEKIVLLPLYPHYSKTATGTAFAKWRRAWDKIQGNDAREIVEISDYFQEEGFIEAHRKLLGQSMAKLKAPLEDIRILFSAHSLPQKVIDGGDPYQQQTEITVKKIMEGFKGVEYRLCYQSRVGPIKWLEPSTLSALKEAAFDKKGVVIVPVSFTSEHSETLVELDMDYALLAKELKMPFYVRVPALSREPAFINFLKELVEKNAG